MGGVGVRLQRPSAGDLRRVREVHRVSASRVDEEAEEAQVTSVVIFQGCSRGGGNLFQIGELRRDYHSQLQPICRTAQAVLRVHGIVLP